MSVKISRTTSTAAASSSRSSKSSSSKSSSSKSSSSKSSSSKSSGSSKGSSSKASSSSKSSSKTSTSSKSSNSKSSSASKNSTKSSSGKASSSAKTNSKTSSSKSSGTSSAKGATKNTNKISSTTKNTTSSSNSTKSSLISNVNSSIIGAISGVKYIMDAPAIYTKQAVKSTVASSAATLAVNPPKGYIPGMPSKDYEKYKKSISKYNGKTPAINTMLKNIDKDKSLKLSKDKKTAMLVAGEKLLNKGYDAKFVAGVLGNIMNEGTPGKFESSAYGPNADKPEYLKFMEKDFNYDDKYSGSTIGEVGIKETINLQKQASKKQHTVIVNGKKKTVQDQFGFGMCQFTGDRTSGVLDEYKKFYDKTKKNNPTQEQCAKIEAGFMVNELKSDQFSWIYEEWNEKYKTASKAGELICTDYEKPYDLEKQALIRGDNANAVYDVMIKKN